MNHDVLFEQVRDELLEVANEPDADMLLRKLTQYDDPESAVAIYLEAAALEKRLAEVKDIARSRIETYLRKTGEVAFGCKAGKAVYTQPKTPKLDTKAWKDMVLRDPILADWQHKFDVAAADLDKAQEPFKVMPAPTLRITG
jgi:hypothetical protein